MAVVYRMMNAPSAGEYVSGLLDICGRVRRSNRLLQEQYAAEERTVTATVGSPR